MPCERKDLELGLRQIMIDYGLKIQGGCSKSSPSGVSGALYLEEELVKLKK